MTHTLISLGLITLETIEAHSNSIIFSNSIIINETINHSIEAQA